MVVAQNAREKNVSLLSFNCDVFRKSYNAWRRDAVEKELSDRMDIHLDSCSSCMTWVHNEKNSKKNSN